MISKAREIELSQEQLHKMQMIQLEILIEFDKICKNNKINYSLDGGTLLGAVRHEGFIPWDDDIDVIMLRDEYEKFFKLCDGENKIDNNRFFLQDYRTDKHYNVGYARIRRKGTVYERVGHEHMKYQKGVFIDIFILDSVPDSIILRYPYTFICFCLRKILWSKSAKVIHENRLMRIWYNFISLIPNNIAFRIIRLIADICNKNSKTELVRHMTHPYPSKHMIGMPRKFLFELVDLRFEGYLFSAIKNYDEYLTMLYGDYMTLPPEDKRKPHIHLSAFKSYD